VEDSDRIVEIILKHTSDKKRIRAELNRLAVECSNRGKKGPALAYAEKMLLYADTNEEKAYGLLCKGQLKESSGDYGEAMRTYRSALDLPPERNDAWYLLNNNLGYCLNWFGMGQSRGDVVQNYQYSDQ
jgi:tetratricopeptide (TPR) repeat protein